MQMRLKYFGEILTELAKITQGAIKKDLWRNMQGNFGKILKHFLYVIKNGLKYSWGVPLPLNPPTV